MHNRETPFQAERRRQANAKLGWPSFTVEIPLSEAEREFLATSANLKGVNRDDEKLLGNALKSALRKEMGNG